MFTTQKPQVRIPELAQGRTLVLVDFENLCLGTIDSISLAELVRDELSACVSLTGDEHVVIATSHAGLLTFGLAWPGARVLVRSGQDGADLELLSVLREEHVADRFEKIIVASGDGIFTDEVSRLAVQGCDVTVVSRPAQLSRRLKLAAKHCLYIPDAQAQIGEVA